MEFYRRVKRYRVDPSGGSASNPVPGESNTVARYSVHEPGV